MSIKSMLVSLNDTARNGAILDLAADLANRFDAHLSGLFVTPAMQIHPVAGFAMTPELFEPHNKFYAEEADKAKAAFDEVIRRNDLRGEWQAVKSVTPVVADQVVNHGRQSDLVIVGQVNMDADSGIEADFCEQVAVSMGRPVLMVPYAGSFQSVGKSVVVGWNGTREAARAAFDALPFMRHADEVRIVWVNPQDERDVAGDLPGTDLAATLARHGIKATAEAVPTGGLEAGEALLNRVSDAGADLLVMGAYGHSRMREFVFGGATRSILENMTVPVLLSH